MWALPNLVSNSLFFWVISYTSDSAIVHIFQFPKYSEFFCFLQPETFFVFSAEKLLFILWKPGLNATSLKTPTSPASPPPTSRLSHSQFRNHPLFHPWCSVKSSRNALLSTLPLRLQHTAPELAEWGNEGTTLKYVHVNAVFHRS